MGFVTGDSTMSLNVKIRHADTEVQHSAIFSETFTVGRLGTNKFAVFSDPAISRVHFQVEFRGSNEIAIVDLQSRNGTIVNDKTVPKEGLVVGTGTYRVTISSTVLILEITECEA